MRRRALDRQPQQAEPPAPFSAGIPLRQDDKRPMFRFHEPHHILPVDLRRSFATVGTALQAVFSDDRFALSYFRAISPFYEMSIAEEAGSTVMAAQEFRRWIIYEAERRRIIGPFMAAVNRKRLPPHRDH